MPTKPGSGVRSTIRRDTHQFRRYGYWWRSEQDFNEWWAVESEKRKQLYKQKPKVKKPRKKPHNAGKGVSSEKWRPTHQYKGWSRWWRTEEDFLAYRRAQNTRARADKAGMTLKDFVVMEKKGDEAAQLSRKLEAKRKAHLNALKEKHGLRPNANRTHLKAAYHKTGDPELRELLFMQSFSKMNSDERLQHIRQLFLDGHKPLEIMYQTALIVGIRLGEKQ